MKRCLIAYEKYTDSDHHVHLQSHQGLCPVLIYSTNDRQASVAQLDARLTGDHDQEVAGSIPAGSSNILPWK